MNNIVLNKYVAQNNGKEKTETLWRKVSRLWRESVEIIAPGVCAMNNTYYRPVKQRKLKVCFDFVKIENG